MSAFRRWILSAKLAQTSAIFSLSIIPLSHFRSIMMPRLCRRLLTKQNNRWQNSDELFQIAERRENKHLKQIRWIWVCSPLKKTTNVFVTGIRLVSDTLYPNGLTLRCIQSDGIKTLFGPADVSWQDIGLKVMKVVSLKLVSQVWSIPLLIISTTVTFHWPLRVIDSPPLYINNTWRTSFMSCKICENEIHFFTTFIT